MNSIVLKCDVIILVPSQASSYPSALRLYRNACIKRIAVAHYTSQSVTSHDSYPSEQQLTLDLRPQINHTIQRPILLLPRARILPLPPRLLILLAPAIPRLRIRMRAHLYTLRERQRALAVSIDRGAERRGIAGRGLGVWRRKLGGGEVGDGGVHGGRRVVGEGFVGEHFVLVGGGVHG